MVPPAAPAALRMMVTAFAKPFASMFIASREALRGSGSNATARANRAALEGIDRVGADIGADVDEHRILLEPAVRAASTATAWSISRR